MKKKLPRSYNITDQNEVERIIDHYSDLYGHDVEDSPDKGRSSMNGRIHHYVCRFTERDWVLDLGAGIQILEKEYIDRYGEPRFHYVTLDIARVDPRHLLARKYDIPHVRANGIYLPFKDDTFSLIVSNMSLDFMPTSAIDEVYRVLKPSGHLLVNLHHPSLVPEDLDYQISIGNRRRGPSESRKSVAEMTKLGFYRHFRNRGVFLDHVSQVYARMKGHGFNVGEVKIKEDRRGVKREVWWEVDSVKPRKSKQKTA